MKMGNLKIKETYQNKVVKRDLKGFGTVSVDTKKLEEKDYEKWKIRGLDIFVEVEEKPKEETKAKKVEAPKEETEAPKETAEKPKKTKESKK